MEQKEIADLMKRHGFDETHEQIYERTDYDVFHEIIIVDGGFVHNMDSISEDVRIRSKVGDFYELENYLENRVF